jgi:hypothetical protein
MVAGLSPINSRNLIIDGRCSPSLQPKRLFLPASGAAPIRRRTPIANRGADLVEVRLLLCSRALLGSDVNRSIRSAGRKRVGLAPAGPD